MTYSPRASPTVYVPAGGSSFADDVREPTGDLKFKPPNHLDNIPGSCLATTFSFFSTSSFTTSSGFSPTNISTPCFPQAKADLHPCFIHPRVSSSSFPLPWIQKEMTRWSLPEVGLRMKVWAIGGEPLTGADECGE